jgi:pimeloyl-ACP methyl ester carboxylesterase
MSPAFFTLDRIPAVSRVIGLPAPMPPAVVRSIAGSLYRRLAFADPAAVDQTVVDHFTQFHTERTVIRDRLEYAKRLRAELDDAFDPAAINVPVTVIWGEADRLCMPAGAAELGELVPHADVRMIPNVGHTPQVEAPNLVVEAIVELCERST